MKCFVKRRLVTALCLCGVSMMSEQIFAAAFQLWEQDGASVGNYHAGYAALANDASTAFYNPAGIIRIKNQQAVFGGAAVMTDFKFEGTVAVNTILGNMPRSASAQGGNFGFLPSIHYVAPISDWLGFGFSVDVPFGLKTTYGRTTILQYAATTTAATVVDISPSFGFYVTDKASFGLGLDVQRMYAEYDQAGGLGFPTINAEGINKLNDTGYGGHFGVMYQFNDNSRAGLSYHSQVVHHLNGASSFVGPLAVAIAGAPFSSHTYADITLPAYTALSGYQRLIPNVAIMGSVIYTQWNTYKSTSLHNVSAISGFEPSTNVTVTVPEYYHNSWNISVGADYDVTDATRLRFGLGYDQSPVSDNYRTVALPDNDRYAVAFGGHYQGTKALGFDIGWTHLMIRQSSIHSPPIPTGDQIALPVGRIKGGADVLAGQITWDIA